jgi:hypothetical protein
LKSASWCAGSVHCPFVDVQQQLMLTFGTPTTPMAAKVAPASLASVYDRRWTTLSLRQAGLVWLRGPCGMAAAAARRLGKRDFGRNAYVGLRRAPVGAVLRDGGRER